MHKMSLGKFLYNIFVVKPAKRRPFLEISVYIKWSYRRESQVKQME
jgi:hypothetical protein